MKKIIISGALAAALIVGGGTGAYMAYAKEGNTISEVPMQQQGMNQMMEKMQSGDMGDMSKMMEDGKMNFGQMKPYMEKMHPDLSTQQLEEHYKSMHGTGGASNSENFQEMMGNNL
jgi:hypothetical protein